MYQTMRIMYKTEGGIIALYRGILPTVAGVAPYVRPHNSQKTKFGYSANIFLGWIEFHDLRICTEVLDTGR